MDTDDISVRMRPSPRHSQQLQRRSRPASLRFSRDLEELLQGSPLARIANLDIDDFEDEDEAAYLDDVNVEGQSQKNMQDEEAGDMKDFTELSTLLASAKRKLEMLEGNLKGARNSLFIPALPSPASTASWRSTALTTGRTASPSISSDEGDSHAQLAQRATRITSAPLQHIQSRKLATKNAGHARYNSESKLSNEPALRHDQGHHVRVPRSPKSPKSPGMRIHRSSMDLLREQALNAVAEGEVPVQWTSPKHVRQASSQTSLASTHLLRTQAQGVRHSLQRIKRQSIDLASSDYDIATSMQSEVQVLEATLSRQEEAIHQLERIMPGTPGSPTLGKRPNRALDEQEYFQSAEDGQSDLDHGTGMYTESELDEGLNGDDGFDYETYILNAALGHFEPVEDWSEEMPEPPMQHEEYRSNYAEHETAADRLRYSGRSSYDSDRLVKESLASEWPVPPVVHNSHEKVQGLPDSDLRSTLLPTDVPTESNRALAPATSTSSKEPTTSSDEVSRPSTGDSRLDLGKDQDATSVILSALLTPSNLASPASAKLDRADQSLLFSLAVALRDVCAGLGGSEDIRERLMIAEKVLRGEV